MLPELAYLYGDILLLSVSHIVDEVGYESDILPYLGTQVLSYSAYHISRSDR